MSFLMRVFSPIQLRVLRSAISDVRLHTASLLGFSILFRLLLFSLMIPTISWIFHQLVQTSGHVVVSNTELIGYTLSPLGALSLLIVVALTWMTIYAEYAGMMLIASSSEQEERVSSMSALMQSLRLLPRYFQLGFLQVCGYVLLLVPFGLIATGVYFALLSESDINYYLATKPPEFWQAVGMGIVLAIGYLIAAAWLYLRWVFALPILIFDQKSAFESLRESNQKLVGQKLLVGWLILGWIVLFVVGSLVLSLAIQLIGAGVLKLTAGNTHLLIVCLGLLAAVNVLVAALLTFLHYSIHCCLLMRLFVREPPENTSSELPEKKVSLPKQKTNLEQQLSFKLMVWSVIVMVFGIAMFGSVSILGQIRLEDEMAITAHRGASLVAPENTMAAFEAAITSGVDYIELDVQETRDGRIVVLHDADLKRIASVSKNIWDIDFDEVRQLDIGSWFSKDFADQRVPTLEEVMEFVRGKCKLNIELKYNKHDDKLAERVVHIIHEQNFIDDCVVTSLEARGVREVKQLDPKIIAGLIVTVSIGNLKKLDFDFFSMNAGSVNGDLVHQLQERGKQVHVWTVNTKAEMNHMLDIGVDNIITDDPKLLHEVLNERKDLTTEERILLSFKRWYGK